MDSQMGASLDSLLAYDPAIVSLCSELSFQELKSLSIVSIGWYEATNSFVINRAVFHLNEKSIQVGFFRKYKQVEVRKFLRNWSFIKALCILPDSVEELDLFHNTIISPEVFKQLQKLTKLKRLGFYNCRFFTRMPSPTELALKLETLIACVHAESLDIFEELIKANNSIQNLSLNCANGSFIGNWTFSEDFETDLNVFLKNINLPVLQSFSITLKIGSLDLELNDGMRCFFRNHRNLKVCVFKNLLYYIDDQLIRTLRHNCKHLERFSCDSPEESEYTLEEFKLMTKLKHLDLGYSSFDPDEAAEFNPRQLESFTMNFSGLLSTQTLSVLQSMTNIRCLDLCSVSSSIIPFLAEQMPHLEDLILRDWVSGSRPLLSVVKFEILEKLEIYDTESTADQLLCFINAPRLRVLLTKFSDSGLRHMVDNSPLIEELMVIEYTDLSGSILTYVADHLLSLSRFGCQTNAQGLKLLLKYTLIEKCYIFADEKQDLVAMKKWIKRSRTFEYKKGKVMTEYGRAKRIITNGARTFFLFYYTE